MSALSTAAEWTQFLNAFAKARGATDWPGNLGASDEQFFAAETKLKVKLPPSYRAFLSASNGWRNVSSEIPMLRPVEKIRWFKKEHRDWVEAYVAPMAGIDLPLPPEQDYFDYRREDSVTLDVEHLAQTLCTSQVGDSAALLLNPMVVWPDGEWETWFFANWLPGAIRYRSFADWMRHELARLLGETFEHAFVPGEVPTVYLDGPAKAKRRVRPREEVLSFAEALGRLASKKRSHRIKAVQHLGRMGTPQAIDTLLTLLQDDYDFHVRCEAADFLGRLRVKEAIELLITVASGESHASSSAVQALGCFGDERSAEFLVRLVEEDGNGAGVAAYALAKREDYRGIPPLIRKLLSKEPRDQHTGNTAARLIAEFGQPGFLALQPLVTHSDVEVRRRASVGVFDIACLAKDTQLKREACELLEQCFQKETDAVLHQSLAACVRVVCKKNLGSTENPFSAPS